MKGEEEILYNVIWARTKILLAKGFYWYLELVPRPYSIGEHSL